MKEEQAKRKRYEELLENPLIQEFIELEEYKDFEPASEKTRIHMIKPISVKRQDSNHIYVEQGTYKRTENMDDEITFPCDKDADYKVYTDLETGESEVVLIKNVEEFESESIVIHMPRERITLSWECSEKYYMLQEWFYKELLTKSQQEVVKSLMDPETVTKIFEPDTKVSLVREKRTRLK